MPARAPAQTERLFDKAHAAHRSGALAQAERHYRALLDRDPHHFDALHLFGFLHYQRGRLTEALRYLSAALRHNDRSAETWLNHGLVLHDMRRYGDALASYDAALRLEPDNPDSLNKRGIALLDLDRAEEALACFTRALDIKPDLGEALGNRGNALVKLNRPHEAIASYDSARAVAGDSAQLLTNRAHALRRLDRLQEALADLTQALAMALDFPETHFELSLVQLALGDFERGWRSYEWRWGTATFAAHRRGFSSPLWSGEQTLSGKTILLHAEQGFGDTIQFARYVPLVAGLGASIVLEVQPELVPLMSSLRGAAHVVARGEKLPHFELHCPLMSLPRALKTEIATIPSEIPYLKACPKAEVADGGGAERPRVGVVWAGNTSHHNDRNRSIPLSLFTQLFENSSIQFISLQRDLGSDDAALLASHGVESMGADLRDFADTAALIAQLDLVVSVDTAVAHLAGALGKPITILLPYAADFRWLRQRHDSPWYPTARLIRQPAFGDWTSAIAQLRADLPQQVALARAQAP